MSRKAWGVLMVLSLFVSSGAGFYLYTQMDKITMPATPLPAPVAQTPPVAPAPATPTAEAKPAVKRRNILFRFPKPSAKQVFLTAEFNNWGQQAMIKKGKVWELSVELEPGSYKYLLIVDGKKIRDPNNKNVNAGQSVLTVKPI